MNLRIGVALLTVLGISNAQAATNNHYNFFPIKYDDRIISDYSWQDGFLIFENPITLHAFWFTNYGFSYQALHSYTTTIKTTDGKITEYFRIVNSLDPNHRAICGFVYYIDDPTEDSMCAGFRLKTAVKNVTSIKIEPKGSVDFNILNRNRYHLDAGSPSIFDLFIYSDIKQIKNHIPLIDHANVPLPAAAWLLISGFASLIAFRLKGSANKN